MRRRATAAGVSLLLLACAIAIHAQRQAIQLSARWQISAGAAWDVTVTVQSANAGDTAQAVIVNGLQRIDADLLLGTGGVAVWQIPAGTITQAGESLVVIEYAPYEVRRTLNFTPNDTTTADLFTSANAIPAYGEASATLMLLPRDEWGNAPPDDATFAVDVLFPDGSTVEQPFTYTQGIGWTTLRTQGEPGRVRIAIAGETLANTLEIWQVAGAPADVDLRLVEDCVLSDGRDLIQLVAAVSDAFGNAVVDGTFVQFAWKDGLGYGATANGEATLRIPTPRITGTVNYTASAAEVDSNSVTLTISEEPCVQ